MRLGHINQKMFFTNTPVITNPAKKNLSTNLNPNKEKQDEDWSHRFGRIGGLPGAAQVLALILGGVGGYSYIQSFNEERKELKDKVAKYEQLYTAANQLGLERVQILESRSLQDQVNEIKDTESTLWLVGTTGRRLVCEQIGNVQNNPLRKQLIALLDAEVKVYFMVYHDSLIESLMRDPTLTDKSKDEIKRFVLEAKPAIEALKTDYPSHFFVRYVTKAPPFHGSLSDHAEAHVARTRLGGVYATPNLQVETYHPGPKLKDIMADFNTVWDRATESNEIP